MIDISNLTSCLAYSRCHYVVLFTNNSGKPEGTHVVGCLLGQVRLHPRKVFYVHKFRKSG